MTLTLPARPQLRSQDSYLSLCSEISDGNEPLHLSSDLSAPSFPDFIRSAAPVLPTVNASPPTPQPFASPAGVYGRNLWSVSQNAIDISESGVYSAHFHPSKQISPRLAADFDANSFAPRPLTVRKLSLQCPQILSTRRSSMETEQFSPKTRSRAASASSFYALTEPFSGSKVSFINGKRLPPAQEYNADEFSPTAEVFHVTPDASTSVTQAASPPVTAASSRSESPLLPHEHIAKYRERMQALEEDYIVTRNDSGQSSVSSPWSYSGSAQVEDGTHGGDSWLGSPGPSIEHLTFRDTPSPNGHASLTPSLQPTSGLPSRPFNSEYSQGRNASPGVGGRADISNFKQELNDSFNMADTRVSSPVPGVSKTADVMGRMRSTRTQGSSRSSAKSAQRSSASTLLISGEWSNVQSRTSSFQHSSAKSPISMYESAESGAPSPHSQSANQSPSSASKKSFFSRTTPSLFKHREKRYASRESASPVSAASSPGVTSPGISSISSITAGPAPRAISLNRPKLLRKGSALKISSPVPGSLRTGEPLNREAKTLRERKEEARQEKMRDELKKKIRVVGEADASSIATSGSKKGKKLMSRDKK